MKLLLQLLWDKPRLRTDYIDCWHYLAEVTAGLTPGKTWTQVRGIVSAAWAHLRQLVGVWEALFRLKLLGATVDLLTTSPLSTM